MFRYVLLFLTVLFPVFMIGCAGIPTVMDSRGVHRMSRYAPNVTTEPAGIPSLGSEAATREASGDIRLSYKLSPGDEVMISLRGIPSPEDIRNVIDSMGEITLPLIGQIKVAGLSASEAERVIETTYVDRGFFRSINVIMVAEDKSYFVQGEVGRQGRFRLSGEVTLLKAISEAGGYSPFANRKNVKVIRGDEVMFFNARDIAEGKEEDPIVQANDIIEVLRSVW